MSSSPPISKSIVLRRMRLAAVGLALAWLGACAGERASDPLAKDHGSWRFIEAVTAPGGAADSLTRKYYYYDDTLIHARTDSTVTIWVKIVGRRDAADAAELDVETVPHRLMKVEIDCEAEQYRGVDWQEWKGYEAAYTGMRRSTDWQVVTPNTLGYHLYRVACALGKHGAGNERQASRQ
ncbi:surface-adhesin E family protein [Rhodocaloribacter sp.]